jgi:hypothetical protein
VVELEGLIYMTDKRENENFHNGDISDLFRQRVLSGEKGGSMYFLDDLAKLEKEGVSLLSIKINASELATDRESTFCDFLKAFLEDRGKVSKEAIITGTKEQRDYLVAHGCANALNSGVKFEIVE